MSLGSLSKKELPLSKNLSISYYISRLLPFIRICHYSRFGRNRIHSYKISSLDPLGPVQLSPIPLWPPSAELRERLSHSCCLRLLASCSLTHFIPASSRRATEILVKSVFSFVHQILFPSSPSSQYRLAPSWNTLFTWFPVWPPVLFFISFQAYFFSVSSVDSLLPPLTTGIPQGLYLP